MELLAVDSFHWSVGWGFFCLFFGFLGGFFGKKTKTLTKKKTKETNVMTLGKYLKGKIIIIISTPMLHRE